MTKKEAAERKTAWQKALREHRVVRYDGGLTLRSYLTPEAAAEAVDLLRAQGRDAELVTEKPE